MREDEESTGGGKHVPISGARKHVAGIFISCLGFLIVASFLVDEFFQAGARGGSIEVESEEGKGSTFTVKLPIQ